MKHLLFALMLSASVLAIRGAHAQMLDIQFDLKNQGDRDNSSQGITIAIPVVETGDPSHPIDWDATMGYIESRSRDGSFIRQNFDDGSYEMTAVDDGSARYLALGIRGRYMVINEQLEGILKASYNQRIGGSTVYSRYAFTHDGELFDPYGGVNVGGGANVLIGRDQRIILGGSVDRTLKNGKTVLRLSIGARL
jgi:hypothetical protein